MAHAATRPSLVVSLLAACGLLIAALFAWVDDAPQRTSQGATIANAAEARAAEPPAELADSARAAVAPPEIAEAAPATAPIDPDRLAIGIGAIVSALENRDATAQLEARVRDDSGAAIPGARVRAWRPDTFLRGAPAGAPVASESEWSAVTDWQGIARLLDVAADTPLALEVLVGVRRTRASDVVVRRGATRVVEITFTAGAELGGWINSHDGRALVDCELWLTRVPSPHWAGRSTHVFGSGDGANVFARARSDKQGRFEFGAVPAGHWWVGPAPGAGLVLTQDALDGALTLEIDALAPCALATQLDLDGFTSRELTLRVQCGLLIGGRVLDPHGRPHDAGVQAHGVDAGVRVEAEQLGEGEFLIGPLPHGRFALWAEGGGEWADSEQLVVDAGARDVELRLRRRVAFAGRVTGLEGGAGDVRVFAIAAEGIAWCPVRADGAFELRGMPPGRYEFVASTDGGWFAARRNVSFTAEASEPVELALQPGARLEVRCDGNTVPARVKAYDNDGLVAFATLEPNARTTLTVPAGRLRVEARLDENTLLSRDADTRAGETALVEFSFR